MKKLYEKLKNYTLKDALEFEKNDRQFKALEKLEKHFNNKEIFLALIISNALICYQLSGTGENYWEEFSNYFEKSPKLKAES
jgi:DNA-(apurinic or apyrimidinic site) lyase